MVMMVSIGVDFIQRQHAVSKSSNCNDLIGSGAADEDMAEMIALRSFEADENASTECILKTSECNEHNSAYDYHTMTSSLHDSPVLIPWQVPSRPGVLRVMDEARQRVRDAECNDNPGVAPFVSASLLS